MPIFDKYVYFSFSSRRRHTSLQGDWSSDVCSSDLYLPVEVTDPVVEALRTAGEIGARRALLEPDLDEEPDYREPYPDPRSEERRVGKGCSSRAGTGHQDNDDKDRKKRIQSVDLRHT